MSTHSDGIAALVGCACAGARDVQPLVSAARNFAGRAGELPLFSSPAAMKARAEDLLGEAARLDAAIRAYRSSSPQYAPWAAAWSAWFQQFGEYVRRLDWADRLFGSTAEQIETYAGQLAAWQEQYRQWGGMVYGVQPPAAASSWRTLGLMVAAGLITAGALYVLRSPAISASAQ